MFQAEDLEHCLIASSVYATDIDWLTVPDDHVSSRRPWALSDSIFSICNRHRLPSHSWTWGTHFPPKTGWIVWSQQSTLAKILSERLQDINHQARNSHYTGLFIKCRSQIWLLQNSCKLKFAGTIMVPAKSLHMIIIMNMAPANVQMAPAKQILQEPWRLMQNNP